MKMEILQNLLVQNVWISSAISLLVTIALYNYKNRYYYWSKRGVKGAKPGFPIISEIYTFIKKDRLKIARESVRKYGKVYGIYALGMPRLVIADAEVLRQVCIKDFDAFPNHQKSDTANKYQKFFLVWLQDDYWKKVRSVMSPTFTSGKIKRMFRFIDECANDLVAYFQEQLTDASDEKKSDDGGAIVNLKDAYSLFTMDGITTCCYGLKLQREKGGTNLKQVATRNDFVRYCMAVMKFKLYRIIILTFAPRFILKLVGFHMQPERDYDPLVQRVSKLIENRRQAGSLKKYDDLLQLLIDAKMGDKLELNEMDQAENHHAGLTRESLLKDQEKMIGDVTKSTGGDSNSPSSQATALSDAEILAEAVFLLAAGLETTNTLLTNCTYILAFQQDIQQRLYEELAKIAKFSDEKGVHLFDYDSLTSCQYLDAVISESLRFFSPVVNVDRQASRDYYIEKYNIHVKKGETLFLGIYAVQNDPDYWEEPTKFNPDRFMPGNKEKIVPGSYAPFSMGPRHCIGMRFSLTEAKLGLAKVLMNFKFEPAPNTPFPPEPATSISLNIVKNPLVRLIPRH